VAPRTRLSAEILSRTSTQVTESSDHASSAMEANYNTTRRSVDDQSPGISPRWQAGNALQAETYGDDGFQGSSAKRLSDASTNVAPSVDVAPSVMSTEDAKTKDLRKRLTTLWSRKKSQPTTDDSVEDLRGPFGLRLLHASPEPLIELIFVHGLRGGSIKTWRKGEDYRLFWPKFFLPTDPEFRNASIYSFGYDSDWAGWGSSKHSILSTYLSHVYLKGNFANMPQISMISEITS
jgi:hypothetical protein